MDGRFGGIIKIGVFLFGFLLLSGCYCVVDDWDDSYKPGEYFFGCWDEMERAKERGEKRK